MRNIFLASLALLWMPAFAAIAEPTVRSHTNSYFISGASATVLAAQINQKGPQAADGKRYAGRTRWDVQWKLRFLQQGTLCSIKEATVAVGVAQTLPQWRGERDGPATLRAQWRSFMAALVSHENTHLDHAQKAGKEIEAAILAVKPASNCEDLGLAANAVAEAIVAKYQALDLEFDRKTGHGLKQGAALL